MNRQAAVNAGHLVSDVVSAVLREKPSLPRRRIIGSVMLLLQCSFEEAASGLDAAVMDHLEKGYSCSWDDETSMIVWGNQACFWVQTLRQRRERGRLVAFPGGAQ